MTIRTIRATEDLRRRIDDLAARGRALRQDSDPQDLIGWGADLARYQDEPELMARLFERLGPEGTALLLRLTGFAADRTQSYPGEMVATLDVLKTALANGSTRMRDARGFAEALGRWLLPPELSGEEEAALVESGGLPLAGPAVLAQMLRGTSYDPDFLAGLAERVEHFERSADVDPVDYYKRMTPARYDEYQARDIPALIFEQLSRHPDVAHDHLGGTDNAERRRYWFGTRAWPIDGQGGISAVAEGLGAGADEANAS